MMIKLDEKYSCISDLLCDISYALEEYFENVESATVYNQLKIFLNHDLKEKYREIDYPHEE